MVGPTIRQLATIAGVSRTTVSLALHNHPRLPEATRRRIQRLAKEHGYNQDPIVASLMARLAVARPKRVAEKIAFLTYWPTRDGWKLYSASARKFFLGASERAQQLGYSIEEMWAREPGLSAARLSKILYTRGIRGVLIGPLLEPKGNLSLDWRHFATATCGFSVLKPDIHRVAHPHFNGMRQALHELERLGYRRIGFATRSDQNDRVNHGWLGAYLAHARNLPAANQIPPYLSASLLPKAFKSWVETHRPDVVVSNLTEVWELLTQIGLKVPKDVGFASLDLLSDGPQLAGIDQCHHQIGAAAADIVIKLTQNHEFGLPAHPVTMHIEGAWREGASVRQRSR